VDEGEPDARLENLPETTQSPMLCEHRSAGFLHLPEIALFAA
jgi:hypothetical protein